MISCQESGRQREEEIGSPTKHSTVLFYSGKVDDDDDCDDVDDDDDDDGDSTPVSVICHAGMKPIFLKKTPHDILVEQPHTNSHQCDADLESPLLTPITPVQELL